MSELIKSRLETHEYNIMHDLALKPKEAFRTAGIVGGGIQANRATFVMSVRAAGQATGMEKRTLLDWQKTLPNAYVACRNLGDSVQIRDPNTGFPVHTATTEWTITGYPDFGHKLTDWCDRMLPSDPAWANQGHNDWRAWSVLKFDGPMTVTHLSNLTNIPVDTLRRKVRTSLLGNGLLDLTPNGREVLWNALNPATTTHADIDLALVEKRAAQLERERSKFNDPDKPVDHPGTRERRAEHRAWKESAKLLSEAYADKTIWDVNELKQSEHWHEPTLGWEDEEKMWHRNSEGIWTRES